MPNLSCWLDFRYDHKAYPLPSYKNGNYKAGLILVDGKEKPMPDEGGFYRKNWRENGNPIPFRRSTGTRDLDVAVKMQEEQVNALQIMARGGTPPKKAGEEGSKPERDLIETVAAYVRALERKQDKDQGARQSEATLSAYSPGLNYFMEHCCTGYYRNSDAKKTKLITVETIESIDRDTMLEFTEFLKTRKKRNGKPLSKCTIFNRFKNILTFLNSIDYKVPGLKQPDYPPLPKKPVIIYEPEQEQYFFGGCTVEQRLKFEFFRWSGFRKGEVKYFTKADIHKSLGTVAVAAKLNADETTWGYTWKPKGAKEREVPIPPTLLDQLVERMKDKAANAVVFPDANGNPDEGLLEEMKGIVERLNEQDRAKGLTHFILEPKNCILHRWRAAFATNALQGAPGKKGTDLVTVQGWMGHSTLAATIRYLRPASGAEITARLDEAYGVWSSRGAVVLDSKGARIAKLQAELAELERSWANSFAAEGH